MPNKITYTITTADGKEHQVSKENVDKYGIQSYADAYKGATIRMRDAQKGDYDIPLQHFDNARKQGLHAFSLEHTSVQKQAAPKPTPTPSVTTAATPQDIVQSPRPQSQKDRPMTAVEKASMISNVGNIVNTTQAGLQRTKNMMTYAKSKAGLHVEPVKLGKKNNVVETAKQYNPKTGKMQSHYLTEAGNEYDDKTQADIEQEAIDDQKRRELDPVQSQLEDAYSERDRLEEAVSVRRKELEDEYNNRPWYQRILTEMGKASHSNVDPAAISTDPEHMGFAQDEQYMQLMSAIRKNHQTIQTLEDKKNGQMNSFWHSLGTTLANGYIFADGLPEMRDATAILNAQKHIDSINRKRKTGQALTKEEAAAEAVLHNTQIDNVVQGTYGSEYGAWARAGRGTAYSADFMKDFLLFPAAANIAKGVAGKVAGIGGKYLAKEAGETAVKATAKAIARATLKATGVVVGAHTAGAVISNTTGIGRTVAKMGQLSAGAVSMDKNGNYKMENQQDLMSAFAEAEREQAGENGSEMFGEFIPGGKVLSGAAKKALSKIGLGRISDMLINIGNKAWYKNYTTLLEKGGYNGIPGEALEEYEGMFFDAITGHADEGVRDFTDPKQQVDIWLGCATMGALMGAVPMGLHIQGYYRYKQGMNKADRTADFRLTPKRWQPLKEQIDQTDNGNMAGFVVNNILNNKSLEPQEKEAAMNYVRNLTKFRGFNIAQVNNADDEVKDTQIESRQQNEAYSMGYNLQDEKELNNTAILYDEAKKQATKATGWDEDALDRMIGEDGGVSTLAYMKRSDDFNDEQLQAFTDYANARAAYNGMIQRVKDDIDTRVHESNLEVEQRTNLDTGAIHPATMKVDDRQVYVVNGNVVMLPDGSGVDLEHSDDFVVLRDAKTGELETADPSAIFKVDTPINSEEEKEAAADNIRQTVAQQQADKIDGKLEFKQGDTYTIVDKEDGTQHSLTIIGDAIDEKTGQVNPDMVLVDIDGTQQPTLLPKEQVQQQVDEARRAAVVATQVVEHAPTDKTNNTYDINDEVTLTDENGNVVRGSITAPQDEDGKFEVQTERPINGKTVNKFSAEELDSMTKVPAEDSEDATIQQPQQQEDTEESIEKEAPQQQTTALERIPTDESGQPLYEQTDPETAWDAIVEQTEGDMRMAQTVADDMVADMEAAVKKAEKIKTKGGGSIAEKIAAEKERSAAIEQAKQTLAHWKKIAAVNRMRESAIRLEEQRKVDEAARVRKEQEEKVRAEQEEAERIKREALNGVPDFVEDKASHARSRGYRRVNGDKVDRQEPIDARKGKEVQVKFDDNNIPRGHVAIIEAHQLQPSHKNGQRNPLHFIDEAQPKERKDDASVGAARKIAANIRPEEITSSVTAYTGAPTVNSRGEVIQGNNRSAALREMWDNHQEQGDKYKQYLIDNAASFGLRVEDIAAMDKPVLVNMLDVNDEEAISLGQFVASDTESGGTERIKPKNVVKKLGEKMKNFANILLRANDENISFAELVDSNGVTALKWLNANGIISPTQYNSAFDSKGNLTAEAKNDIKGIMYQSIFEGGNTQLEEMFNALPAKAQKAILATAYRDYDSPQSERMVEDIQDSIMAYYALSHDSMFMNAKSHKDARIAVEAWRRQLAFDDVTGESYLPAEKYSNFALLLATMYKGDNQLLIQGTFNRLYDLIQGTQEETLFEKPDNTPRSLAQAIKETLNIDYNGQQRSNVLAGDSSASQEGRTGSNGDATSRGRSENIDGTETHQGGTEAEIRAEQVDKQGNPINADGTLKVDKVNSINELTDADFENPTRNVELPAIPENVDKAIGANSKPVVIKKNIFEKNKKSHNFSNQQSRDILTNALYNTDLVGQTQPTKRPKHWVAIQLDEKSPITVLEVNENKDNVEVVGWYTLDNRNLERIKRQAANEGGELLMLSSKDKVESLSTPNSILSSVDKDKQSSDTKQENVDNYLEKPAKSEDLFAMAERVAAEDEAKRTRKKEEAKVDTNPTEAQKEAGNYRKGHIKVDGMDVTIEQPKGSVRRGKDVDGKEWESKMYNTYGYIRGTESVDGDHIDIFLSDTPETGNVFVIDQVNKDGSFDEHKVMYGFSDMESAKKAYLSNYEDGWQGLGNITGVSKEEFKKWIDSSKYKTKPFAEYSSVKTEGDVNVEHPIESSERTKPETENRLVTDERYEELKKRMKAKLRGQLNMGVDPEMLAIGAEMAVYHIESGARAFGAYAKEMISDLGDAIRPYLKAFYNGARDLPEMTELSNEMTPYEEVSRYNVATIGNEGEQLTPSAIETAEQINNEAIVEFNAKQEKSDETAKNSQKENKDSNIFLSHKEYIEKELISALKQTKYKTLEEWEDKDTENYAQKYDDILETYEDYVRDLAADEKLQVIYDKSSVKTQKEIREHLTDADLDYHEFINTSPTRLRIQDRLTQKSKYAKGEFSDGTIVSGEVVRWSPTSLTVNSRGTLYTINANKVLEQSNEPMNADGHEYKENGSLQYSTEDLTNNTTAKRLATDTILSALNKAGIEVVRATDEQVQELLANTHATSLRTPQGTIYGWAVDGKIYLTEAGINPDTPIHEYTHLWAEAMMSKNKKGWNSIKALLKETPVWKEVVADPNYSNIMNDEDAVASEVLSRISGKENAARMVAEAQKVIDKAEGVLEKAKATTMLLNIKEALRNFWEWIGKSVFNIRSFSSIDEVTDKILYDLVNATRLNTNKNESIIGDDNIEIETAERDKQYLEAVQRGDMYTARRLVNEAAERNGYTSNSDYQGTSAFNGAAPYGNGYFFSREKRKEAYENDEFDGDTSLDDYINSGIDPMNLDFLTSDSSYRHADDARKEAIKNLRNVIENKRQTITMYRSVPSSVKEGNFRNGDWITPSYAYAVENAKVHGWGSDFRIIEQEVPIDEVWFDGNDIAEFGYGNEDDFVNDKDYLYSNTKNNRKLPDVVTYDDNGNIIPLSKRFNKLKGDPRFQIKKDALSANGTSRSNAFDGVVNKQFNEALQKQIDGVLPKGYVYNLGMPNDILHSAGIPNLPIELVASRLSDKAMQENHPFDLGEVKDLPHAIQNPLAVFRSATHIGSNVILTNLKHGGRNYVVAVETNRRAGKIYVNSVRSVHYRNSLNIIGWINDGLADYISDDFRNDWVEEKKNELLSKPQYNSVDVRKKLISATKIVKDFENPMIDEEKLRDGYGSYTNGELSFINDPVAKMLGENKRSEEDQKAFAERERQRMMSRVSELADRLHLDNVEVVTDSNGLQGKKAKAKGFYSKSTGKITIVIPNHSSVEDVEKTLLHEAVAHYGLRKLFGEHFDTFLDNVYQNVEPEIRREIVRLATKNGWDFRTATEEYLASLAERTDFERVHYSIWDKIKSLFLKMLHGIGFENWQGGELSDNELRYLLWRSYENMKEPGRYRSILGEAEDIAKQNELKIGNYAEQTEVASGEVAEASVGLDEVNERFNKELNNLTEENADKVALNLGTPSAIQRAAGVENKPMKLYGNKVIKKMKKHGFSLEELQDLPKAVANPIAVFDNYKKEGNRTILTELRSQGRNIMVAITLGKNGVDVDFNIVSSVFGKGQSNIIDWINKGYLVYVNKEKALNYLHFSERNISEASNNQELNSVAKIVKDFENPSVSEENVEKEDVLYRQGSNDQSAYDIYENAVKDSGSQTMLGALARGVFSKDARTRFKNKFAESYFDYSRSIKQLQDAIEESLGVKLDSYEDVWRTLNAKGSADAQEVNLAMLRYIAPLAEHIGNMIKGKRLNGEALTVDDVEKYMNAVHSIERNKHMQEAAFRGKLIKKLKSEGYSIDESEAIAEAELDNIRQGNGSMYMDIYDNARKDYSGLTALFGDEVEDTDNVDELEAAATQYANDFGKAVGMDKVLELWDKVRALNDFSLRKSYLSGLISKAQYEGVKQMYQYYVPLRGWHEGTAGDIYEYISRGERTEMLESALKTAKGRKSRAGDILGTMAAMVNTAIVQGNRNLVAQKFLNMALNYGEKSGLLMVGKQWYEESANGELTPLFPHLHDGMTLQEQQDEIERFEKDMEEKRKVGKVRELRRGFNQEIGLRMPKWQEQEHCVRVMRNGREHQVYVLGNPRAAQAFNGLLNKQAKSDILRDGWAAWMRAKATMQTSLSPEFVFSNFQRDILTAGTGTYIKFGRKAGVEFAKNLTMLNPMAGMSEGRTGGIFTLIHRYNKGTLDKSNEVERMFEEFVRNGGMTGVSVIESKDEYQKSINKAVKRIKQGKLDMGRQAVHGLADAIEFMNSGIENATRFAAYMVSRKTLGKSVTESVFDAKEASVNFNMKGSGAWLNLWMRRNILYANPAIQSLRMLGTWYEASPKRFMGALSTIIATSVTMAMLWASIGAGDGDDDNDWYKLSEWNRYNYLNIWTGNGYAHWSLSQEFRPVWALGQIVFDWQKGMISEERAINSMMTQLNNLSPMAFFSGGMDSKDSYCKKAIRAWTPTIAADFADAYIWNENFLGQKITNQEDYNIDSPEFQRAGKNTPQWAVSLSKLWNNVTDGAENRKSYWDSPALNPSALYYLAQQQLGGFGTMVTKLSKAYEQLEDPNGALEAKNIPFVSKVWVSTEDTQSKNRVTNDKFWMIYNDWKLIDSEMRHNKSDVEKGKMSLTDLAERMAELQQNGDYMRWARLRSIMKSYNELRTARNNGADVEEAMDELKKVVVKGEEETQKNK